MLAITYEMQTSEIFKYHPVGHSTVNRAYFKNILSIRRSRLLDRQSNFIRRVNQSIKSFISCPIFPAITLEAD